MKIRYERLFNLGEYEHEKFAMEVDVPDATSLEVTYTDAKKEMAKIAQFLVDMHECFSKFRFLEREKFRKIEDIDRTISATEGHKEVVERLEQQQQQMQQLIEKGNTKALRKFPCTIEDLENRKGWIERDKIKLANYEDELEAIKSNLDKIRNAILKGNFEEHEEIELVKSPYGGYRLDIPLKAIPIPENDIDSREDPDDFPNEMDYSE